MTGDNKSPRLELYKWPLGYVRNISLKYVSMKTSQCLKLISEPNYHKLTPESKKYSSSFLTIEKL